MSYIPLHALLTALVDNIVPTDPIINAVLNQLNRPNKQYQYTPFSNSAEARTVSGTAKDRYKEVYKNLKQTVVDLTHNTEALNLLRDILNTAWNENAIQQGIAIIDTKTSFFKDKLSNAKAQQECRYLVKDSGTSESPKSTHQRGKYFSLDCPASDIFALTAPGKMSSQ